MKTEKEKMLAGELYNACDAELSQERIQTRLLLKALNDSQADEVQERAALIKRLIPQSGKGLNIEPPFYCDYGKHISIGDFVFFNFNCVILDVVPVTIGHHCQFGPHVQIYTATHPLDYTIRARGLELGKPITIGNDVWIGGGTIICPGVSIGDRSVIGAGSVVTKDIPSDVMAAGNPCKLLRQLP